LENPTILNERVGPFAVTAVVNAKEFFNLWVQLNGDEVLTHGRIIRLECLFPTVQLYSGKGTPPLALALKSVSTRTIFFMVKVTFLENIYIIP
jgi:hypothetical protein